MSNLYTAFRTAIGDSTAPYSFADTRLFRNLDVAIDKISNMLVHRTKETITITSADLTNGYFEVTNNIESVEKFSIPKFAYDIKEANKISIVDEDYFGAGDYEIEYNAYYKRFGGEDHENSYFDYPDRAELGIILYALGIYTQENNVISVDGDGAIKRKREGDMSVEYVVDGSSYTASGASDLRKQGLRIFQSLPNTKNYVFSIPMYR